MRLARLGIVGERLPLARSGSDSAAARWPASAERSGPQPEAPQKDRAPTQRFARLIIVVTMLLLAAYAVAGVVRLAGPAPTHRELTIWFMAPLALVLLFGGVLLAESLRV